MSIYELGPFQLDAERLLLLDRGMPVALGPKVIETLLALVERPGVVLTKAELLARVWPDGYVGEANLAQNVYVLRKTLRARWAAEAIETIPRRGYRFGAPVREIRQAEPAGRQPAAVSARRRWASVAAAVVLLASIGTGVTLTIALPHRAVTRTGLSPEGVRLYEIGRYNWNLRTRDGVAKSIEYFRRVVRNDPRDPRGYAALASADAIVGDYEFGPLAPAVYIARARAYAQKALALDPNCGEAYAVLGMIASEARTDSQQDMPQAVTELQHAIALDPGSGPAHEWYGVALVEQGQIDAAYAQLRKAAELDPLSVATTAWLGNVAYLERHYGDAVAYAREALDLSPRWADAYETLGLAYQARGDQARAIDAFRRLGETCKRCRVEAAALLAAVYARSNRVPQARAELEIAKRHPADVAPADLAAAYAAVGERSVALSWLRRSAGDYLKTEIANDPRFAALRNG